MEGTLVVSMVVTYLLVKVNHVPTRVLWLSVSPMRGGNLPAVGCRLPLKPCKGPRSDCLEIFINSGYACVKFSATLEPAGGTI